MWFKRAAAADSSESARPARSGRPAPPSILSSDLKIEGDLVSEGDLHINGSVKGDIVARKLTVGEGGSVTGSVEVEAAVIAGNVSGRLAATSVTLSSTARVVADVTHVSLLIEQGAVFEGFSRRVDNIADAGEEKGMRPRLNAPTPLRAEAD